MPGLYHLFTPRAISDGCFRRIFSFKLSSSLSLNDPDCDLRITTKSSGSPLQNGDWLRTAIKTLRK